MKKKIILFLLIVLSLTTQCYAEGKYGNPNAPFSDICNGHIINKQKYDFTFNGTRVFRTTYFCEDGTEEYFATEDIEAKEELSGGVEEKSPIIVEVHNV